MKTVAVIMAGGKGERFWPKSRRNYPKQFLSLAGDGRTMLQLTADRHKSLVDIEDVFVVTNQDYVGIVRDQLPQVSSENILAEPFARNTAPCIGFAATVIRQRYGDAIMLVLAADHLIKNETLYMDTLSQAIDVASEDENLVTVGIVPSYPETGYGYINFGRGLSDAHNRGVYLVKRFVEKPDIDTAKEYLESGDYLWNSGMFVWKVSTILKKFETHLPNTYEGLCRIGDALSLPDYERVLVSSYSAFKAESIDYGIMERASGIYTIPGNFGWDDVGSWLALERINRTNENGNMVQGDVITIETSNSIIVGDKRLIATIGLDDVVIVDSCDAILICGRHHTGDIKKVIENLKICNRNELI